MTQHKKRIPAHSPQPWVVKDLNYAIDKCREISRPSRGGTK